MEISDYLLGGATILFAGVGVYHFVKGTQLRNRVNKALSGLEENITHEISATHPIEEQEKYRELNTALDCLDNSGYKNRLIVSQKNIGSAAKIANKYGLTKS